MRITLLASAAALVAVLASCDTRTYKGALSGAADSAVDGAVLSRCDTARVDFELTDVRLPLRSCGITRADTAVTIVLDGDSKALIVSRAIAVDSGRQRAVHDSIQFALGALYEAPVICPESDGLAETDVRLWRTLDRELVLKNVGATRVVFELRTDHPRCHEGD